MALTPEHGESKLDSGAEVHGTGDDAFGPDATGSWSFSAQRE